VLRNKIVEAEIRFAKSIIIKITYNDFVNSQKRYVKKKEKSINASRNVLRNARLFLSGLASLNAGIKGADRFKLIATPLIEQIGLSRARDRVSRSESRDS
jgi:hypothetical protein